MKRRVLCLFIAFLLGCSSACAAEDMRTAIASLPDNALIALHAIVLEELMNRDIGNARKQQLQLEYSRYGEHIASGIAELAKAVFYTDNIGNEADPEIVWISEHGTRYHTMPECCGMNNPSAVSVSRAIIKGLTPCKDCAYRLAGAEE